MQHFKAYCCEQDSGQTKPTREQRERAAETSSSCDHVQHTKLQEQQWTRDESGSGMDPYTKQTHTENNASLRPTGGGKEKRL